MFTQSREAVVRFSTHFLFSCSLQTLCRGWDRLGPAAMDIKHINCHKSSVSELTFFD